MDQFNPSLSTFISALLVAAALAGCAAPENKNPVTIKEATRGTAVIYFFRPQLDQVEMSAQPILAVDDRAVGTLEHETYTAVSLSPGVHRFSLSAGSNDSANWNQSDEVSVKDGVTYYVAVWHQNQPTATPDFVRGMYGAVGGLLFQATHAPQGSKAARFESVDRDVAEAGLAGLRFVPPRDNTLAVH